MKAEEFKPTHWTKLPNNKYLGIRLDRTDCKRSYIFSCVYENFTEVCGDVMKSEMHFSPSGKTYFRRFNKDIYIKDFQLGFTV